MFHCEEFFGFELELLIPLWQAMLGLCCSATVPAAQKQYTLLGNYSQLLDNSSWWSDHEFDCSALFAYAWMRARWHCTMGVRRSGTSYGGYNPDTHDRKHGLHPQRRPSPQDESLWGTTLLSASRKAPGRYPEDTTRSVRICMIPIFSVISYYLPVISQI